MAEDKIVEQEQPKKKRRAKTQNQIKLDTLRVILRKGLKCHKDAIDKVIYDYNEYVKYDELVKKRNEYDERIKAVEAMKATEKNKSEESK